MNNTDYLPKDEAISPSPDMNIVASFKRPKTRRSLLRILGISIMVVGIITGAILVQKNQQFRELACDIFPGIYPSPTPTLTPEIPTPTPTPTAIPSEAPTLTPTSTPTTEISATCNGLFVYDTSWNLITAEELPTLKSGDIIRFATSATVNIGYIDKARFIINGVTYPETTLKKPGTEEYYYDYTIPEGVTTFQVKAELHHSTQGWF